MAEPASLAERAHELAGDAGALAHNLELFARQLTTAQTAPAVVGGTPFVYELTVFVLAVFVGYYVVWRVNPALDSPLMSVTNRTSLVIVCSPPSASVPGHIPLSQIMGLLAGTPRA